MTLTLKLSLLFLFCFGMLKAQTDFRPGYVVTNNKDTLRGLIDYRGDARNAVVCNFRQNSTSEVKRYHPGEITSYRFENSRCYLSKIINSDTLFLELLVDGIADLYFFKENDNTNHFFIEKANGKIFELTKTNQIISQNGNTYINEKKEYIGRLRYAFSDAPQLFPSINQLTLEARPLMNITRKYHNYVCDSARCIVYQKQVQGFKFRFAPFISMNASSLSFYTENYIYKEVSFQTTYNAAFGIQTSSPIPWTNEKITMQASAEIGKCNFYGKGYYPGSGVSEEAQFDPIVTTAKLGVKYTYPTGKIRPTILAGGTLVLLSNTEGKRYQGRINPQTGYSPLEYNEDILAKIIRGYAFEFGLNYHYSPSRIWFLSFGYSRNNGTDAGRYLTRIKTLSSKVGFYF